MSENRVDSRRNVLADPNTIALIERVVHDEAGNQGVEGRNAVRAVIYNRVAANRRDFGGGTVLGVLNAPKQFQGVMEKAGGDARRLSLPPELEKQYVEEHVNFLRSGQDPTDGATFFQNPKIAKNPFRANGGKRIGDHVFYDNYNGNKVEVPDYNIALRGFKKAAPKPVEPVEPTFLTPEPQTPTQGMAQQQTTTPPTQVADSTPAQPIQEPTPNQEATSTSVPNPRATAVEDPPTLQPYNGTVAMLDEPLKFAKGGMVSKSIKESNEMKVTKVIMGGMMAPEMEIGTEEVSGNPIPPGSLPEEVADDVPVLMSEGEVVLAADVVRWHGLKHIMEMRDEAKMGLMCMHEDGQIQVHGEESEEEEDDEMEDEGEMEEDGEEVDEDTTVDELVGDEELITLYRKDGSIFKK